ncbi:glycoside hydrolase family 55 protein [Thermothelomyces thermophilus ATCC 42464]|uniref:Glycoside hydrolase family 55 protein n=1 Tax=Thermothelomyces thermophilus (strain ATCC 42464 / BCRC 31852 / DSM 1799) TaxID=573729 RepID=G2QMM9_THET4|nr:glycoside hydrolase family 55 protein [Thermothelomyces thermophilus ATCC 42464]AEO61209.1 glycoside hydrolase family 55 protein [Thermothelomyces thermophilus ATCC 42464]
MQFCVALLLGVVSGVWAAYWMEDLHRQGLAPFAEASRYSVFRNVKQWGAKGDGAINAAISDGDRCGGPDCVGSTTTPAIVYFPPGTYMISSPIFSYYYTQIIGDPTNMPVIKASQNFPTNVLAMLDADRYMDNGRLNFLATNVFFRQLRNLVFDTTAVRGTITGIHWPSSQATLVQNCVFKLSSREDDTHVGIFMEEGSGGMMADLIFHGGKYGARFGNQQYTMRNLTFYDCDTAIEQIWNWGWTYKSLKVVGSRVGINMSSSDVGSVTLLDSSFVNVSTALISGRIPGNKIGLGSLLIQNVEYKNVPTVLAEADGRPLLLGDANGTVYDRGYARGNTYAPNGPLWLEGHEFNFSQPSTLKIGDRYYERSKPQYEDYSSSDFISARDHNAFGDGRTDDTDMINKVIQAAANSSYIAFLDAGYYRVTDTIFIPPNTRVMGEGLATVIMGTGEKFSDPNNPRPVVQVGKLGDTGFVEINDLIASTQGPAAGAIMIEYNLNTPAAESMCSLGSPPSGMWDVHVRVGGFRGSQLQVAECPTTPERLDYVNPSCIAGYMGMHISPSARNLYLENSWIWVADHDVDDWNQTQISVFVARGMLVQGSRIWLVGSSVEHHALYQYQLLNASDVWMGQIQTETPYYQPNPPASYPFTQLNDSIRDPDFTVDCRERETENSLSSQGNPSCAMAWGLRIIGSQNVVVFGAGLYSFFNNYNTSCSTVESGENCQARIFWVGQDTSDGAERQGSAEGEEMLAVEVYNLNTIGSARPAMLAPERATDSASG